MLRNSLYSTQDLVGQKNTSTLISYQRIPSWNTAGRPKKAKAGTVGFNFKTSNLEYWNGTAWLKLRMKKI